MVNINKTMWFIYSILYIIKFHTLALLNQYYMRSNIRLNILVNFHIVDTTSLGTITADVTIIKLLLPLV